jgi:hypothetical protein
VSEVVKITMGFAFGHRLVIINVRNLIKPCLENVRTIIGVLANVYAIFTFVEFLQPRRCMI